MQKNTALRKKPSMDEVEETVPDPKGALPASILTSTNDRNSRLNRHSSTSLDEYPESSGEGMRSSGWIPSAGENFALTRLADQEVAVYAYRNLLKELGAQIGSMEAHMERQEMQALNLQAAASVQQQACREEAIDAEMERAILLEELKQQADEFEFMCQKLRQQRDDAERHGRRNKQRADARIAELNLVIETSHLDFQCLRDENRALRKQLAFLKQKFIEQEHGDNSGLDFSS